MDQSQNQSTPPKGDLATLREALIRSLIQRMNSADVTAADYKEARETIKAFQLESPVSIDLLKQAREDRAPFRLSKDNELGTSKYRKSIEST